MKVIWHVVYEINGRVTSAYVVSPDSFTENLIGHRFVARMSEVGNNNIKILSTVLFSPVTYEITDQVLVMPVEG